MTKTKCSLCKGGGHLLIADPFDNKRKWAVCPRCQGTGGRKSPNPRRFPDGIEIVGYMDVSSEGGKTL